MTAMTDTFVPRDRFHAILAIAMRTAIVAGLLAVSAFGVAALASVTS